MVKRLEARQCHKIGDHQKKILGKTFMSATIFIRAQLLYEVGLRCFWDDLHHVLEESSRLGGGLTCSKNPCNFPLANKSLERFKCSLK